jgi:hypothetical protein
MTRSAIGTPDWGAASNGRLTRGETLHLAGMVVQAQARELLDRLAGRSETWRRRRDRVDPDQVPTPDTAMVRHAEEEARDVYGAPLALHCHRTYWWGALLAQFDELALDSELLLVASLLHDLGLAPSALPRVRDCCFAHEGATQAHALVKRWGWDAPRADRVAEAISLHLNPVVDAAAYGAEAALLARGATLDVIGAGRRRLPARALAEVDRRFPRNGFAAEILGTITYGHASGTRAAFLAPGFAALARRNPLDREDACTRL